MDLKYSFGFPIAVHTISTSPHVVTLIEKTLDACFLENGTDEVIMRCINIRYEYIHDHDLRIDAILSGLAAPFQSYRIQAVVAYHPNTISLFSAIRRAAFFRNERSNRYALKGRFDRN